VHGAGLVLDQTRAFVLLAQPVEISGLREVVVVRAVVVAARLAAAARRPRAYTRRA